MRPCSKVSGLAEPIAETKLFPAAVTQMLAVGEGTGTLDDQLESMAAFYEQELEYKLKNLTTMFEPMAILVGQASSASSLWLWSRPMYGIFGQVEV